MPQTASEQGLRVTTAAPDRQSSGTADDAALDVPGIESSVTADDEAITNVSRGQMDARRAHETAKVMKRQELQLTLARGLKGQLKD